MNKKSLCKLCGAKLVVEQSKENEQFIIQLYCSRGCVHGTYINARSCSDNEHLAHVLRTHNLAKK